MLINQNMFNNIINTDVYKLPILVMNSQLKCFSIISHAFTMGIFAEVNNINYFLPYTDTTTCNK